MTTNLISSSDTIGISYLDGHRIRRAMLAGIAEVIDGQEHLNKINVFPVADGDTGTNLALTMNGILSRLQRTKTRHAGNMLTTIADAALDGARGNSGAILAQYFQGLSDVAYGQEKLNIRQFATAVSSGNQYAREALSKPIEGTVLTIMRDFAQCIEQLTTDRVSNDFVTLLRAGVKRAKESLANTPTQLEALRKAGVVDAGAEGFVRFLDGIYQHIVLGNAVLPADLSQPVEILSTDEHMAGEAVDLDYRYCTECIVTGSDINRRKLREGLSELGGSLVFAGTQNKVKIHIHVNDPAGVFELAAQYGQVAHQKADDMQQQQDLSHHQAQQVVVTIDSAADLPDQEIERLNLHMIPVRLHFGDESYLDKVSITVDKFFEKLDSHPVHPKTSQPSPGELRRNFEYLSTHYQNVLSINVTSAHSGTHQAALNAAKRADTGIHVYDSKLASVGQALIAMHAAECAQQNMSLAEILEQLELIQPQTQVYGVFPDLSYAVRGGRVKPLVKTISDLFRLAPVFSFSAAGHLKTRRLLPGKNNLTSRLAKIIGRDLKKGATYRFGIAYGTDKKPAEHLLNSLLEQIEEKQCHVEMNFVTRLGSALGAHSGPKCLVVGIQRRDGTNANGRD